MVGITRGRSGKPHSLWLALSVLAPSTAEKTASTTAPKKAPVVARRLHLCEEACVANLLALLSVLMDISGHSRRMGTGKYMALLEQHPEKQAGFAELDDVTMLARGSPTLPPKLPPAVPTVTSIHIFIPCLALSTSTVETTLQLLTLMFTSRGQSSLSTLAFLLHLYLPTIFLLLPVFLPLLSDADPPKHCQCVPSLVAVSSITLALASILVAGDGSGIVGEQDFPSSMFAPCSNRLRFLLPDLTLNRANGHGYLKATPTTIARQHRQLQVDTDSGDKDISDDSEAASMTTGDGRCDGTTKGWS
ncbi:hypothetical protein EDB84DRAFT_1571117 [Lactarius hengduanensis]|nr:hypothetical protein EDB84DRAFT_1571117 [Lactarius hengduanensis]